MKDTTKEDAALLEAALHRLGNEAAMGEELAALDRLKRAARAGAKMGKHIRGMFDDGMLDPYPTSDTDPQRHLRKLSQWKDKESTT